MPKTSKKKTAQDHQPGEVGATLRRRMGPALAELFDQAGTQLYSQAILAVKENMETIFTEAVEQLEGSIQTELGKRGQRESAEHFGVWVRELVEDMVRFGMTEISGALEDMASSAAAKYVSEEGEGEEGEELLAPEAEEVEEVEEEPVEEPAEEEEAAPEEPGLEELMAPLEEEAPPEEEGEAAASPSPDATTPRRWKRKNPTTKKTGSAEQHAFLTMDDIVTACGGLLPFHKRAKTEVQARKLIAAVQAQVIKQVMRHVRFATVTEVNPAEIKAWIKEQYQTKRSHRRRGAAPTTFHVQLSCMAAEYGVPFDREDISVKVYKDEEGWHVSDAKGLLTDEEWAPQDDQQADDLHAACPE